jgi:hypothetical protein
MAGFDISTIRGNDRNSIGAGVAFFVLSLLPWYHVALGEVKQSENGWGLDGWCKLGILLSLAATVWLVLLVTGNLSNLSLPVGPRLVGAALAAAAALVLLIRIATVKTLDGPGFEAGRSFPWFLALLAVLAQAAFAFLGSKEAGEALPGRPADGGTLPPPAPPAF